MHVCEIHIHIFSLLELFSRIYSENHSHYWEDGIFFGSNEENNMHLNFFKCTWNLNFSFILCNHVIEKDEMRLEFRIPSTNCELVTNKYTIHMYIYHVRKRKREWECIHQHKCEYGRMKKTYTLRRARKCINKSWVSLGRPIGLSSN